MQTSKRKLQPKSASKISGEKPNLLELDRVIGNTAHASSFAYDDNNSLLAYPAGCVVILFNTKRNKQTDYLSARTNKPVSCLCFSRDGKYLAVGESGHQPSIVIWDIQARSIVAELKGHKYGVGLLAFTPNGRILVSVGVQHDACINVWEWRSSIALASAKFSGSINGLCVSEDNNSFVTVGMRHLKFWSLDTAIQQATQKGEGKPPAARKAVALEGKYIVFGKESEDPAYQSFVDVSCAKDGTTYALTAGGILFSISPSLKIETMRIKNSAKGVCVSATDRLVACGLKQSVVELWDPKTRQVNSFTGPALLLAAAQNDTTHRPDCVALRLCADSSRLFALYSDRSIFVWDTTRPAEPVRVFALAAHADCIWDLDLGSKSIDALPEGTFTTASSDGSIRFWNIDTALNASDPLRVYGKDMHRCLSFADLSRAQPPATTDVTSESDEANSATASNSEHGVRCVRISRDGRLIASGDRQGNLRIHDIATNRQLHFCEAHDSEILSMDWSQDIDGHTFLATGGRDRIIHVFDATDGWKKIESLADHSSSVTCVRFLHTEGEHARLISSGADKSVIFRSAIWKNKTLQLVRYHLAVVPFGRVFHLDFDPEGKQMITSGQEKKLNLFNVSTGKAARTFKLDSDVGELLKVELDPSGSFAATAGSDRSVRIYDYHTGEIMGRAIGHGDAVTGVKWLANGTRLVSTSGDGTIFIYRTAHELSSVILSRLSQASYTRVLKPSNTMPSDLLSFFDNHLPAWAKGSKSHESFHPARGRWAERVSVMVYSEALREVVSARPWTSKEDRRLTIESKENASVAGAVLAQLKDEKSILPSISLPKLDDESSEDDDAEPAVIAAVSVATQQPATKAPEAMAVQMVAEVTPVAPKEEKEEKKEDKDDDVPLSRFSRFATFDLDDSHVNSRRLSLSAEFRRTAPPPPAITLPPPPPVATEAIAAADQQTAEPKKPASILESAHISRKEEIAREVERTRMRLAKLGLIPSSSVNHRPNGSPNRKSPKRSPKKATAAVVPPPPISVPTNDLDSVAPPVDSAAVILPVESIAQAVTMPAAAEIDAVKQTDEIKQTPAEEQITPITVDPISQTDKDKATDAPAIVVSEANVEQPTKEIPATNEAVEVKEDEFVEEGGEEEEEEITGEEVGEVDEEEEEEDACEEEVCVKEEIPANLRLYHEAINKLEENFEMILIIHQHLKAQQAAPETRSDEGERLLTSFSTLFGKMQDRLFKETAGSSLQSTITHYSDLLLAAVKTKLSAGGAL